MAIQAEVRLAKQIQFHRLMSQVLHRIFIRSIQRLSGFILGHRRIIRAIDLLDK